MRRARIDLLACVSAGTVAASACDPKSTTQMDASTPSALWSAASPTDASGTPATRSAAPSRAGVGSPWPRVPCRAVSVEGDVRAASPAGDRGLSLPLAAENEIPEDAWIGLGRGARFVAKDPRTTRETIFYGPGRVRACSGHREESWIALGAFESERGAGETPGAEEWVITPQAVVRFAAAKLRVQVGPTDTTAHVANGMAMLWVPADTHRIEATAEGPNEGGTLPNGNTADSAWQRIGEGAVHLVRLVKRVPIDAARSSLDQCSVIARRSEELTRALLALSDAESGAPNGRQSIAEEVATRELARAACAVAALRVRTLGPSGAMSDLEQQLQDAEQAWTALPVEPPSVHH